MSTVIAKESGHWYKADGTPAYMIVGKNGKERNVTLRDARKEGYFPSVTSILKVKAAPGLEAWKRNQILLAAATLPKVEGESVDEWVKRVQEDAEQQAKNARDKGTLIHGWLEEWFGGDKSKVPVEAEPYITGVQNVFDELGVVPEEAEKTFASNYGYGGKIDCIAGDTIIDYKTTEFTDNKKKLDYFEHCIQLAAYGEGRKKGMNIYVSANSPGLVRYKVWTEEELRRGFIVFLNLFAIWKYERDYYPGGSL